MKKTILFAILTFLVISCSDDDKNGVDCSLVDCIGGDIVEMAFIKNDQNILETDPSTEIRIVQNNDNTDFSINTISNRITLFLYEDDPITMYIGDQQLNMEISSTFAQGECCSGIQVDSLNINGLQICNGESCDQVLQISLD